MSKRGATGYMADPDMKQLNDYVNRTTWLMQQGKPTARIAIYAPIPTLWLGNNRADDFTKAAAHQLTRHQYDYDFITDDGIVEACTVGNGSLKNRSGQRYETLIVPSAEVITEAAWQKISEFANRGGRIIVYGDAPKATAGRSFMDQKPIVMPRNVLHVQDSVWTEQMVEALPKPEFRLVGNTNDSITCTVRRMDDGTKIFFVFNQKKRSDYMLAEFNKIGNIEIWDAMTGEIRHLQASVKEGKMQARLTFSPWEAKIFVVKKRKAVYDASRFRDNMTIVAEINEQSTMNNEQWSVGAFVGNECRGEGRLVDGKFFITVHANSGEMISFKLYDQTSGQYFDIDQTVTSTIRLGSVKAPVQLTSSNVVTGIATVERSAFSAESYDLNGRAVNGHAKGITIHKMQDGTMKKVVRK
jgi:hypothetical protein